MLADHTTFRVGGRAQHFVTARTEDELIDAVRAADEAGEALLVLSGGSNLLVGDADFAGTVVHVATRGLSADVSACGGAVVSVQAGETWDDLVGYAISQQWSGAEALSGIPGLVGSTPIQNVGAYGAEVSQILYRVRAWDRVTRGYATFANADVRFDYRDSIFKRTRMPGVPDSPTGRYVVLEVSFQFRLGSLSQPIGYAQLADRLGVQIGDRVDAARVREAVLDLRRSKGMVVDPLDHDTWSAGSFFTNPILSAAEAARLPASAPRFALSDGRVKTSAAWLIEHAGFGKGFGSGPARLSSKHPLALTNQDGASAQDIIRLARRVRDGVFDAFGVRLTPEPVLVGVMM